MAYTPEDITPEVIKNMQNNLMRSLTPNESNETFEMSYFKIDEEIITGYATYSFFNAKSYVKSPVRSASGVIENLNSYATFLTPRLRVKFSMLPLESYRKIMRLLQSKNEFTVVCYDIVADNTKKFKAYFSTEDYPELFTMDFHTLGAINYEIELQGTNADLDLISIIYYLNPPIGSSTEQQGENDIYAGEEISIGANSDFSTREFPGFKFNGWNTQADGKGKPYYNGEYLRVADPLTLYAIWVSSEEAKLSFDYGLSKAAEITDPETGIVTEILSKSVQKDHAIGDLPTTDTSPEVTITENGETKVYKPYYGGGWYMSPSITSNRVYASTEYWTNKNTTIYRLYSVKSYTITYSTIHYSVPSQEVEYNAKVVLPILGDKTYVSKDSTQTFRFIGWHLDSELNDSVVTSMTMPPYNVTLYAEWVEV